MAVTKRKRVVRKKKMSLVGAASMNKTLQTQVWEDLAEATQLVEDYKRALKSSVSDDSKDSAVSKMTDLVAAGQKFILNEKVYKIAGGLVFSVLSDTMDKKSFASLCLKEFDITAQTALRYKGIYDAWFSGKFLYSLPKGDDGRPQNPLDLSVRDLELGATLIVEGELDSDSAGVLFGDGNWLDKKDVLREQKPEIVKRSTSVNRKTGKPTSEEREKREHLKVHAAGGIYYQGNRIGFLDVTAADTSIRSAALRSAEVLKGEFNG